MRLLFTPTGGFSRRHRPRGKTRDRDGKSKRCQAVSICLFYCKCRSEVFAVFVLVLWICFMFSLLFLRGFFVVGCEVFVLLFPCLTGGLKDISAG